ncbi:MAG: fumarate/nitrate reduction transcriptional regulator Fnr [Gammaproteobacteria bacterium]
MNTEDGKFRVRKLRTTCTDCSLSELCLPRGLDDSDVQDLAKIVEQPAPVERGGFLYKAGDPFRALFVVKVGAVKFVAADQGVDDQIIAFGLPGELSGLEGLYSGRYHCSAVALTSTRYCMLPFERIEELAAKVPSLRHELFNLASREITQDRDLLVMLSNRSAEERVATFLHSLGQRFGRRGYSATEFNMVMTRAEIANYLGLAVETVSRVFSRFKESGLLDVDGRYVHLLNPDEIKTMVHSCSRSL